MSLDFSGPEKSICLRHLSGNPGLTSLAVRHKLSIKERRALSMHP